jgi:hypothetical protein
MAGLIQEELFASIDRVDQLVDQLERASMAD